MSESLLAAHPEHEDTASSITPTRLVAPDAVPRPRAEDVTLIQDGQLGGPNKLATSAICDTLVHDTMVAAAGFKPPVKAQMLAGFVVQGVLGRGGMGIVYKAFQPALNRVVALKMIAGGAEPGSDEAARFHIEAESAARLQHAHIVQIYETGEVDGRPYLAIEYVEGGSLTQKAAGSPQPARVTASLIEILARAMHYAHEHGIVHRDLKPGNILLGKPDSADLALCSLPCVAHFGVPKITDFGLAKRLDVDLSQTQTGAILGTPSYMAPEQAAGKVREIGPAADIYALGAILYDLLTGRPPFQAATLADTLSQVQHDEPASPSSHIPHLPRDLVTICLKCLNKAPEGRYASARDLADDLHRFLQGEPIKARRTRNWERLAKWARRRPAAAALAVVSIMAALLLAGGGWWSSLALRNYAQREEHQRLAAEANFRQALDAVDQMLMEVGAVDLADVPQMESVRKRLLQKALHFFQVFLAERGNDPAVRREAARAYGRMGDIHALLVELKPAERAYKQAITYLEAATRETPEDLEEQRELARNQNNLGILLKKENRLVEAEAILRQALQIRARLAHAHVQENEALEEEAGSRYHLATVLAQRGGASVSAAAEMYRQALTMQENLSAANPKQADFQRARARTLNNLGNLLWPTNHAEAEKAYQQAVDLQQDLVARHATVPIYCRELARSEHNLASQLWQDGRRQAAEEMFGQAVALLQRLTLDFPRVPEYRQELAAVHQTRGLLLRDTGRDVEALAELREAIASLHTLVDVFREVPDYRRKLAFAHLRLADLLAKSSGREAEAAYATALGIDRSLAEEFADQPGYQSDLGCTLGNLAILWFGRSRLSQPWQECQVILYAAESPTSAALELAVQSRLALWHAHALLEESLVHQRAAWSAEPANAEYRSFLRACHERLAEISLRLGQPDRAVEAATEMPLLYPDDKMEYARAAEFLARAVNLVSEEHDRARTEDYAIKCIGLLREAVRRGFGNVNYLKLQPAYRRLRERDDFKKLLGDLERSGSGSTAVTHREQRGVRRRCTT